MREKEQEKEEAEVATETCLSPSDPERNSSLGTWGSRKACAEGGPKPCASHSKAGTPGPKRLTCLWAYRL